jgi:hypothetical protein
MDDDDAPDAPPDPTYAMVEARNAAVDELTYASDRASQAMNKFEASSFDITITRADYIVATQIIDVMSILKDIQSSSYGQIQLPISKLDADLRKDKRIIVAADSDVLKLTPPKLITEYSDKEGAFHIVESSLTETLSIGERTSFGQFVQKPGDVLWGLGLYAAKGQLVFVVVLFWALGVMWAFKQWQYLEKAFGPGGVAENPPYTPETYGLVGQWVMFLIYCIFAIFAVPSKYIGLLFGGEAPRSWLVKVLFACASALSPIAGFAFEFLIWFCAVQTLTPAAKSVPTL